jgi:putative ABC transport system permease protein
MQLAQDKEGAGQVTRHEVLLTEAADPDTVARGIDSVLKSGPVATTTRRKGALQLSTLLDLVDLIGFAHWLGFACVGLVLSLVATITVMSVQDRIKECAVLQTIGVRPLRTMRLVLTESTIQCLAGGLTGTLIAARLLGFGGFANGAEGAMIAFCPSVQLALLGTLVSALLGSLVGIVPAIQVATLSIVTALRHE